MPVTATNTDISVRGTKHSIATECWNGITVVQAVEANRQSGVLAAPAIMAFVRHMVESPPFAWNSQTSNAAFNGFIAE